MLPITAVERDALVAHWNRAAPDPATVADRWIVAPILASGTRLPVPVGHAAAWRADGRDVADGILTNTTADARIVSLEGMLTRPNGTTLTNRFQSKLFGTRN